MDSDEKKCFCKQYRKNISIKIGISCVIGGIVGLIIGSIITKTSYANNIYNKPLITPSSKLYPVHNPRLN
jgi:hypothetical protein